MAVAKHTSANHIKKLREERGWSQNALAAKIGTSGAQVNRLENDKRKLTVEWLLRLCAVFGVSADKIADIPLFKVNPMTTDPAMLGLIVGWIIEACNKYKIEQNPKEIGKWTSYVYSDMAEKDLDFKETRALCFQIVKLGKSKKK